MTAIASAVSAALIHLAWQGLLIGLLLWIVLAALRNGSARLRYSASCAALILMAILPVVTGCLTYRASHAGSRSAGQFVDAPPSLSGSALAAAAPLSKWLATLEVWVLPVWFAGVLVFAVRVIWSARHVARLRREGAPAAASLVNAVSRLARRMNVGRPVRVLISPVTESPSVAGWLRPVILLPAAALLNLNVEQLEAVLAHELAHVRRHDYLVNLLQTLVETLFFYHPAVWWVSSRIRCERELCFDDLAVQTCGDPLTYARALASLERLRVAAPGLVMSSTAGPLLYRIQRLTGTVRTQSPARIPGLVAASVAFICFAMNLPWAQGQLPANREAEIRRDAIWLDTVKYGDLPIMVRALGKVITPSTAELNVPATHAPLVKNGQNASIELRSGIIAAGKVANIASPAADGTVAVGVELQSPAPEFVTRPIDGVIGIKTLNDIVYVGRPAVSRTGSEGTIFKMESGGQYATRVKVRFGASSVNSIQVLEGLTPGDRVIVSDMTRYDGHDRVRVQ